VAEESVCVNLNINEINEVDLLTELMEEKVSLSLSIAHCCLTPSLDYIMSV